MCFSSVGEKYTHVDPKDWNDENCSICQGALESRVVVAHSKGGELHPAHKSCTKAWIFHNGRVDDDTGSCADCKRLVSLQSFRNLELTTSDKAKLAGAVVVVSIAAIVMAPVFAEELASVSSTTWKMLGVAVGLSAGIYATLAHPGMTS